MTGYEIVNEALLRGQGGEKNGVFSFTTGASLKRSNKKPKLITEIDPSKQEIRIINPNVPNSTIYKFQDLKGYAFSITPSMNPRFVIKLKTGLSVRTTPKGLVALPLVNNKLANELDVFMKTKTKLKRLKY